MVKIKLIQQAILGLNGGEYQEIMNDYLFKKFKFSNITCLGSESGSSNTTKGTPDTYVETEDGKYILIMYGSVKKQSFDKIKKDIIDAYNKDKILIDEERIKKVICCYTSNNIKIPQREELKDFFKGKEIELIGIDDLSYDIAYNYPAIAKTYLNISIDSGQICDIDEFIEKYDKSSTNAPIDINFIERKEKKEILDCLKNEDFILIIGKAGVGKTRTSIEVCKEYIQNNKNKKCLCIHNNGNDIYYDLIDYIENGQDYLIFIDDINEMSGLKSFMDFIKDKEGHSKIKVLATIRDYVVENVLTKLSNICNPKLYILNKMNDEQIKEILESCYSIKSNYWQEKILGVANGNPRIAVLAAKGVIEHKIENLNSVVDIFQGYYFPIIKENELSDIDMKLLFLISLLGPINIEDDNILKIICKFSFSEKEIMNTVKKLHKLELVDYFEEKAIKTSDQCFSNYVVYAVLIKDKILSISELITKLYPNCILKIINAINMIYDIFYSYEAKEYIEAQIKEIWRNEPYASDPSFLYHFYNADRVKAISIIKKEIDMCEQCSFDLKKIDFQSKENYKTIDDKKIEILSNYKYGEMEDEAIELLIKYYKKRPDLIMDFYFAFVDNFGIDEYSIKNNFSSELKVVEKFIKQVRLTEKNKYDLIFLLIKIIKDYLKYERHLTKQSRKKMTINYIQIHLIDSEEVFNFRKKLFKILQELYKNEQFMEMVEDILLDYEIYPSDDVTNKIFLNDLKTLKQSFFDTWQEPDMIQCEILKEFENRCKKTNIVAPQILEKYKDNRQYMIIHSLEVVMDDDNWEIAQKERKERVISIIKEYKKEDYYNLFETCKKTEVFQNKLKLYNINTSIMEIFEYLLNNKIKDFLNVFEKYIQENAPFTTYPDILIGNTLNYIDKNKILSILTMHNYEKKELFLNSFYSICNDISNEDIYAIFALLEKQVNKDKVYIQDLNSLIKYENLIEGTIEKYCEKLLGLYRNKTFVISNFFWNLPNMKQEMIDKIINKFSNIDVLEELYIIGSCNYMDNKGQFGISLLKHNDKFICKIIENMKNFKRNSSELDNLFIEIWKLDNYEYYIDSVFLEMEKDYFNYFKIQKIFDKGEKDEKNILLRKQQWIEKQIKKYYDDNEKTIKIFEIINSSFPSKKKEYILLFLKLNKSIKDFKNIPLFPMFSSWIGSEIPIEEKKIEFLEEINESIYGLDYIEHKEYINIIINSLKQQIKEIRIREYLEDYL